MNRRHVALRARLGPLLRSDGPSTVLHMWLVLVQDDLDAEGPGPRFVARCWITGTVGFGDSPALALVALAELLEDARFTPPCSPTLACLGSATGWEEGSMEIGSQMLQMLAP